MGMGATKSGTTKTLSVCYIYTYIHTLPTSVAYIDINLARIERCLKNGTMSQFPIIPDFL